MIGVGIILILSVIIAIIAGVSVWNDGKEPVEIMFVAFMACFITNVLALAVLGGVVLIVNAQGDWF